MMSFLIIFFGQYFAYIVVAMLGAWLLKGYKKNILCIGQMIGAAFLARGAFTEIIRFVLPVERPFVKQGFIPLIPHEASASFPSGHAAFFFAVAAVVYAHNKKAGIAIFISGIAISLARVFAGVHWYADIVGGAVIGIISAFIMMRLFRYFIKSARSQTSRA